MLSEKFKSVIDGVMNGTFDFQKDFPSDGSLGLTSEQMNSVISDLLQKRKSGGAKPEVYVSKAKRFKPVVLPVRNFVNLIVMLNQNKEKIKEKVFVQVFEAKAVIVSDLKVQVKENVPCDAVEVVQLIKDKTVEASISQKEEGRMSFQEIQKEMGAIGKVLNHKGNEIESYCDSLNFRPEIKVCKNDVEFLIEIEIFRQEESLKKFSSAYAGVDYAMQKGYDFILSFLFDWYSSVFKEMGDVYPIENQLKQKKEGDFSDIEERISGKYNLEDLRYRFEYYDAIEYRRVSCFFGSNVVTYKSGGSWLDVLNCMLKEDLILVDSEYGDYEEKDDHCPDVYIYRRKGKLMDVYDWFFFEHQGCVFFRTLLLDFSKIEDDVLYSDYVYSKDLDCHERLKEDLSRDVLCQLEWE